MGNTKEVSSFINYETELSLNTGIPVTTAPSTLLSSCGVHLCSSSVGSKPLPHSDQCLLFLLDDCIPVNCLLSSRLSYLTCP
jgi:hypothetical protein